MGKNTIVLAAAAMALAFGPLARTGRSADEGEDVRTQRGDPSPTAAASRVDDYTQQDEQINVDPDTGVIRVLRTNQKINVNDYVTEMFELKHLDNPMELRGSLREIAGKEGGNIETIRDKVAKRRWLQVICPKFQLPYWKQVFETVDKDWLKENTNGSLHLYYKAKNRSADSVDHIARNWGSGGVSLPDPKANATHYIDSEYRIKEYLHGAGLVDIPPSQVSVEAAIYEVDLSDDLKMGLDFIAWKNGPGRNLFETILHGQRNREEIEQLSSIFNPLSPRTSVSEKTVRLIRTRGYYSAANYLLLAAYVDFLASKGKAKLVARPRIVAKNATFAEFAALDQIAGFEAAPVDPGPRGLVPSKLDSSKGGDIPVHKRTLRHRTSGAAGVSLGVTPFIGLESLELRLEFGVSEQTGVTPQGTPILSSRRILSVVNLKDGEPFVLGGLKRREKVESSAKVPILGSIPVVGWLFGGEMNSVRETDLVVVLTPKVSFKADSTLAQPGDAAARAQATETAPAPFPGNPFGFDQWLLDGK